MILFVAVYAIILFIADSAGLGFRLLETSHGYAANNTASLMVGQAGMKLRYEDFEDPEVMDKFQKARESTWIFSEAIDNSVGKLIPAVCNFVFAVYFLGSTGSLILVGICVLTGFDEWLASKQKAREYMLKKERSSYERKNSYLNKQLRNIEYAKEIRIYGMLDFLLEKKNDVEDKLESLQKKAQRSKMLYLVLRNAVLLVQYILVYAAAFIRFRAGLIPAEMFLLYASSIHALGLAIRSYLEIYVDMRELGAYYSDYEAFIGLPKEDVVGDEKIMPENTAIELNNVSFRYPNSESWALRDVNLSVKAGEIIALVGENGSGKTTLVNLLSRLYEPTEGEITLGGEHMSSFSADNYRHRVIQVPQRVHLHEYTIRENIAFDDADDGLIEQIIKNHGMDDLYAKMPFGLDTYVTQELHENGCDFSGG